MSNFLRVLVTLSLALTVLVSEGNYNAAVAEGGDKWMEQQAARREAAREREREAEVREDLTTTATPDAPPPPEMRTTSLMIANPFNNGQQIGLTRIDTRSGNFLSGSDTTSLMFWKPTGEVVVVSNNHDETPLRTFVNAIGERWVPAAIPTFTAWGVGACCTSSDDSAAAQLAQALASQQQSNVIDIEITQGPPSKKGH